MILECRVVFSCYFLYEFPCLGCRERCWPIGLVLRQWVLIDKSDLNIAVLNGLYWIKSPRYWWLASLEILLERVRLCSLGMGGNRSRCSEIAENRGKILANFLGQVFGFEPEESVKFNHFLSNVHS